jgi:SNF2 family DNA or RNA helicase
MVIKDSHYLAKVAWEGLVVDEAQRLKNAKSALFEKLSKFECTRRMLMTGHFLS